MIPYGGITPYVSKSILRNHEALFFWIPHYLFLTALEKSKIQIVIYFFLDFWLFISAGPEKIQNPRQNFFFGLQLFISGGPRRIQNKKGTVPHCTEKHFPCPESTHVFQNVHGFRARKCISGGLRPPEPPSKSLGLSV